MKKIILLVGFFLGGVGSFNSINCDEIFAFYNGTPWTVNVDIAWGVVITSSYDFSWIGHCIDNHVTLRPGESMTKAFGKSGIDTDCTLDNIRVISTRGEETRGDVPYQAAQSWVLYPEQFLNNTTLGRRFTYYSDETVIHSITMIPNCTGSGNFADHTIVNGTPASIAAVCRLYPRIFNGEIG